MKISRGKLRQIIKEELEVLEAVGDSEFDKTRGYSKMPADYGEKVQRGASSQAAARSSEKFAILVDAIYQGILSSGHHSAGYTGLLGSFEKILKQGKRVSESEIEQMFSALLTSPNFRTLFDE